MMRDIRRLFAVKDAFEDIGLNVAMRALVNITVKFNSLPTACGKFSLEKTKAYMFVCLCLEFPLIRQVKQTFANNSGF